LKVVALYGLEKISHSTLQSSINKDAIAKMVEQDCPERVHVTWIKE